MRAADELMLLKLGGEVIAGPHLRALATDVATLVTEGVRLVIVHGGGPQASELQRRLGQTPRIIGGERVTDEAALEVMKMAVAGKVNVDLCAALLAAGAKPVGLHGASARVIDAVKRPPKRANVDGVDTLVDYGAVGEVVGINRTLLTLLLDGGFVPVVACLGANAAGNVFNINGDTVARSLGVALGAASMFVITDVPGVLRDVRDRSSRIPRLTRDEGRQAIRDGIVTGGMTLKLEECFATLEAGIGAIHIFGRPAPGDLAREASEPGSVGTVILL